MAHKRRLDKRRSFLPFSTGRVLKDPRRRQRGSLRSEISYQAGRYAAAAGEAETLFADPTLERRAKLLRARAYRGDRREESARPPLTKHSRRLIRTIRRPPRRCIVAWDCIARKKTRRRRGFSIESSRRIRITSTRTSRRGGSLSITSRGGGTTKPPVCSEDALRRWGREDEALLYYLAVAYGRLGRKAEERKVMEEIAAVDSFSFYIDPVVEREFVLPVVSAAMPRSRSRASADIPRVSRVRLPAGASAARDGLSRDIAPWTSGRRLR